MSRTETIVINRFDGGMTNDARSPGYTARIMKQLDNYSEESALSVLPGNDATSADRSANTFANLKITLFLYANYLSTPTFYGLGVSGTTVPEIYTKTSIADGTVWAGSNHTGDYASLTAWDATQSLLTNAQQAFVVYQDYIYGLDGGGWWKYGPISTTPTWTRLVYTTTTLNVCPPIVHSKYDVMFAAGGQGTRVSNRIIQNSSGTWSDALVFGTYTQIPSICEYGNYLAIAANTPDGTCHVSLWDTQTSLATISEKIDWGSGQLQWIAVVDGTLIGCQILQPSGFQISPRMVFKYYNGTAAVTFAEFTCSSATVLPYVQRVNNRILFLASATINGTAMNGLWMVMKRPTGFTVNYHRQLRLDNTPSALYGFLQTGDYIHAAINDSGYIVSKTGTASTYATLTDYETPINPRMPDGDRSLQKQLMSVAVTYDPLVSGDGVIFDYKVDGGSWTQVFNDTTVGSHFTEMPNAAGTEFTAGRDYEFRVKPSGTAKITGIIYKYMVVPTLV